jgi:hypothetical protein
MKKFSTALLFIACAALFASTARAETNCKFLTNAPDSHVVVKGDTLWGISSKFLEHAWCWPQVWGLNQDAIKNPHWIYPGQVVYFDRVNGRLRLGTPPEPSAKNVDVGSGEGGTVRLSPQIRAEALQGNAIPTIAPGKIEPFLSQPLIVEEDELKGTPYIVATQEGRVYVGKSDKAYVRGDLKGKSSFQIFRPGVPLRDPATNQVIAYEATYLGTGKLERAAKIPGEADTLVITDTKQEMGVGDRLLPMPAMPLLNYVPHAPQKPVSARVVSVYGGVQEAGQNQIISINHGKKDGIDLGTVLQLYRFGQTVADRVDNKSTVKLPDEKYGTIFIFRVFKNISYGLIMEVQDTVNVGDIARSPE